MHRVLQPTLPSEGRGDSTEYPHLLLLLVVHAH